MPLPATAIDYWAAMLRRDGYCIIPDAVPAAAIAVLDADLEPAFAQTPFCQGGFYGATTKRFGRLLVRSPMAARLVQHDIVLGIVDRLLLPWCDTIQLNVTQAIAVHPGAPAQLPHRDEGMWRVPASEAEYLVNVLWPLTAFRADTGATRIWPNTHGPNRAIAEPADGDEGVAAAMSPGSALLFLGSTLHGAGANISGEVRRGVVVGYALGWLKPYENPWLAYPPDIARNFSPELAGLVGYRQHRPNLGNYEGQCPSILLKGPIEKPLAAVDALLPEQREAVAAFAARQQHAA